MAFETKRFEACNAASSRACSRASSRASGAGATRHPYSGSISPEPPNSLGKSLSFGRPSRMRSTVSW